MEPAKHAKRREKLRGSHRGHEGHEGNMKVVRTRAAPNFTLSLKINLCDLGDLCVINSPVSGGKGWSLRLRGTAGPSSECGRDSKLVRSTNSASLGNADFCTRVPCA